MSRTYHADLLADLILRHAELATTATDHATHAEPYTRAEFRRHCHVDNYELRQRRRAARVIQFPSRPSGV